MALVDGRLQNRHRKLAMEHIVSNWAKQVAG